MGKHGQQRTRNVVSKEGEMWSAKKEKCGQQRRVNVVSKEGKHGQQRRRNVISKEGETWSAKKEKRDQQRRRNVVSKEQDIQQKVLSTYIVQSFPGRLHHLPPKFEHIFEDVITFFPFLLCRYF